MTHQTNDQIQMAFDFVQSTNEHIFLTGKAGTGKTTFLHNLKKISLKRMIVVAPTGVAAINAGGVTIHSFFQMPFGPIIPSDASREDRPFSRDSSALHRFSKAKIDIIRSLDLLVIDEISMVRADLLDGIDEVLRRYRRNNKPFGGVQLLMIGDLHQLPPVIKDDEWDLLKKYYPSGFFFNSHALNKTQYLSIELKNIFRQSDKDFITLLNNVRNGDPDELTIATLNKYYKPDGVDKNDAIILTTHNYQAQSINSTRLNELPGNTYVFTAVTKGDFPENAFPIDEKLLLKKGAKVMFIKNDSSMSREYYNGKIGVVTELSDDVITVKCPGDEYDIDVRTEAWENVKYDIDDETKEIKERVIGEFHHYPLKLAWAITIHKSQGLTFDKVIIDARSAFAFGQVYVALSRCKSLDGLILSTQLTRNCIKSDKEINEFTNDVAGKEPSSEHLELSRLNFQKHLFEELFNYNETGRKINLIKKTAIENEGSFTKELIPAINKIIDNLNAEIVTVSEKFMLQLTGLIDKSGIVENNEFTRERIQKAGKYFSEKTEFTLLKAIRELPVETDNKLLRKTVKDILIWLEDELGTKIKCFNHCNEGFNIYEFLKIRAKASIESVGDKYTSRVEKEVQRINVKHPELYTMLKKWRDRSAKLLNLPVARIVSRKVIEEIANKLPMSIKELSGIRGFGIQKRKLYAGEILEVVIEYLKANGEEIPEGIVAGTRYKGDKKVASDKLSCNMFLSGMTVNEIAEERGFTISTIEGHLTRYIEKGLINAEKLIPEHKYETIYSYLSENYNASITNAKQVLGDVYTYSELRMVVAQIKFEKQKC